MTEEILKNVSASVRDAGRGYWGGDETTILLSQIGPAARDAETYLTIMRYRAMISERIAHPCGRFAVFYVS